MASAKLTFSWHCAANSSESICVSYGILIFLGVLIGGIALLVLVLVLNKYIVRGRLRRARQARREGRAHIAFIAARDGRNITDEDLEMHAHSCYVPGSPDSRSSLVPLSHNGGTRMPTRGGLQHSSSVRTTDTLPTYHEKLEEDPAAQKGQPSTHPSAEHKADEEAQMEDVDLGDTPLPMPKPRDNFLKLYR